MFVSSSFTKLAGDEQIAVIDQQQRSIEIGVWQALLAAYTAIGGTIVLTRLTKLIAARDIEGALAEVGLQGDNLTLREVAAVARERTTNAGRKLSALVPKAPNEPPLRFNPVRDAYVSFERQRETRLMRQLLEGMRTGARDHIGESIRGKAAPSRIARQLKDRIGLTDRQMIAVRNYERALSAPSPDRAALERALRDRRFDGTVQRAIRDGKRLSAKQIKRMVDRYTQRQLRHRALVIAQTEATMGANAANQFSWMQAADEGRLDGGDIRRRWVTRDDASVRAAHRAVPGLNADGRAMTELFATPDGPAMFPGDALLPAKGRVGCRCRLMNSVG